MSKISDKEQLRLRQKLLADATLEKYDFDFGVLTVVCTRLVIEIRLPP